MSKLRLNVFANFLGQGWAALLQIALIPIYIKLIGIEAYGLVGFYVVLLTTAQVFDLGLGQTMTREFARLGATTEKLRDARDLLKTVSLVYWAISAVIAAFVLLAAPILASHVIKAQGLSQDTTRHAIMLMAAIIPMQWALNLRLSALMGMERQVLVNALRIVMSTVTAGGAILVLWFVSPTVTAFFWWQILVSMVNLAVIAVMLNRVLPPAAHKPRFDVALLRQIRRFAAGVSGINVVSTIATQLDKWILVTLLPLKIFGYYVLAVAVANSLYMFIIPIFNGFLPRFSILVAQGGGDHLKKLYYFGTQVMVTAVIPPALLLTLFSREVLLLWTRNSEIATVSAPLVSILALGVALNGLMNIPYALQLAYGWTRLVLGINLIALAFLVPAITILTLQFGAIGGAIAWLVFNLIFALLAVPLTHRRLFIVREGDRVIKDVLFSVSATFIVLGAARLTYPFGAPDFVQILYIIGCYAVSVVISGLCASQMRGWMLRQISKISLNMS